MMLAISKRIIGFLAIFLLAVNFVMPAVAAGTATREEAVALAERAAAFIKANGKEKAAAAFMDPKGGFIDRDLYVVMIRLSDGERLSHVNPKLVGKSLYGYQDVDGRDYGNEIMDLASAKGTGWVDYKIANQVTKEIAEKSTYILRVDDVVLAVGIYKK